MKLVPKARPVQCKLILGGKVINTEKELKENFLLTEILALGEKFAQLLRRKEELNRYSDSVSNIFKESDSDEDIALALLSLIFNVEGKTLMEILVQWSHDGVDTKLLSNLLSVVPRGFDSALTLLQNKNEDDGWMFDWLKEVASMADGTDCKQDKDEKCSNFCFAYYKYLKKCGEKGAHEWLVRAQNNGNQNALRIVEEESRLQKIQINTSARPITMIRIKDPQHGDFYIAKSVIPCSMFNFYHCGYNRYSGESESYKRREVCNALIQSLNSVTRYKWRYPKFAQWTKAKETGELIMPRPSDAEWCEHRGNDMYLVANYHQPLLSFRDMAYLRPVLNINDNPELR